MGLADHLFIVQLPTLTIPADHLPGDEMLGLHSIVVAIAEDDSLVADSRNMSERRAGQRQPIEYQNRSSNAKSISPARAN